MDLSRWDELCFEPKPGRTAADPLKGLEAGELTVRIVRIDPGPRHAHVHYRSAEVIHILSGSGWHHQEPEAAPLATGDTVYVPAGTPHATVALETLTLICFFPYPDPFSRTEELELYYTAGDPT